MELRQASRKKAKIKMAIQGPSGAGKTMSALFIAFGLCGSWSKIAVIDTENHSADLYATIGEYKVLAIGPPFTPEKYTEAVQLCINSGIEVIIIDSISHEWEGIGGILEIHGSMVGTNSWANWAKVTPRHNSFVQMLLQSGVHIIGTIRSKQDYVLIEKNGRQVPEKVGMKGVTREGMDYEFTLVLELNMRHFATATKDRTSLFIDKPEFIPSPQTGEHILNWCNEGIAPIEDRINGAITIKDLLDLYQSSPEYQDTHAAIFSKRKSELKNQALQKYPNNIVQPLIQSSNGNH